MGSCHVGSLGGLGECLSAGLIHRPDRRATRMFPDSLHAPPSGSQVGASKREELRADRVPALQYHDTKDMDSPFTSTTPCTRDFNYSGIWRRLLLPVPRQTKVIPPSTLDGGYQEMALNEFNLHRLISPTLFSCVLTRKPVTC